MSIRSAVKSVLFPGVNLHARERYRRVPQRFGPEIGPGTRVLDAGCGNGMLAYQAWKRGARVLGITVKPREVEGCREMFNARMGIDPEDLRFENMNLYDLRMQASTFDAIICTEVLEHIKDDEAVCRRFYELLKPGGCLHVTSPNADHPYNRTFPLDPTESGGHVRPGYTAEGYRALFAGAGLDLEEVAGLGGSVRQAFNWRIKGLETRIGRGAGLPVFLAALPFLWLEAQPPSMPFSLYARARKGTAATGRTQGRS